MKTASQIKEKTSKTREESRLKGVERYLKVLDAASEEMYEKEINFVLINFDDTCACNVLREPEIKKWLQDAGLELHLFIGPDAILSLPT